MANVGRDLGAQIQNGNAEVVTYVKNGNAEIAAQMAEVLKHLGMIQPQAADAMFETRLQLACANETVNQLRADAADRGDLIKKNAKLEAEVEQLRATATEEKNLVDRNKELAVELRFEREEKRRKIEKLETLQAEKKKLEERLQAEKKELEEKLEACEGEKEEAEDVSRYVQNKNKEMEQELEEMRGKMDKCAAPAATIAKLQKENKQLRADNERLQSDYDATMRDYTNADDANQRAQMEIRMLRGR
jgi:chromosome segregation ATPase